ncbi:transcription termination/antitermination protein NusG [Aridibaculum aurantiacum]|uniref:transcription termination/antitermination protein NusG n=1 Tax=Aridibaculum aurantiacum TaxID=2810307 RepID=UPI001A97560B|nr:UpxY family transcription antiterminator [Aridibaculum aurantiacum]
MNEEKKIWRLVVTKPRAEKKVCDQLTKKNIEHFYPQNTIYHKLNQKIRVNSQPLFQRYIFVKIAEQEESLVKQVEGVKHFIYWLGKPATINDSEIVIIKKFTSEHTNVKLEKILVNMHGDSSTLFWDEKLEEATGNNQKRKYCKAILPSLGYAMVAEVIRSGVEILNLKRNSKYVFSNFFTGSLR